MAWIPLMLLAIVVGLSAGVLGILVGLANGKSPFAYRAGVIACSLGVGSPLFFLLVAGRHLMSEAYFFLATPLVAGLPALLLSFRPPFRWLGEADEPTLNRNEGHKEGVSGRWAPPAWLANRSVRATLVLACAGIGLSMMYLNWLRPRQAFERLLAGADDVEVVSLEITGQGRTVLLKDPASTSYLTTALRSATREHMRFGISYTAAVQLSSADSVEVYLYIPEDNGGVTVALSLPPGGLDDPTYYWVPLPEPLPPALVECLRQLR